jgi:hypothetical protein
VTRYALIWDKEKLIQDIIAEVGLSILAMRTCPFPYELLNEQGRPVVYFHWPSVRRWRAGSHPGEAIPLSDTRTKYPSWVQARINRPNSPSWKTAVRQWRIDLFGASQAGFMVPPIPQEAFDNKNEAA